MAKYCIDKYPMGSFNWQKSPGKYIEKDLLQIVDIMAKNIVRDMTFLTIVFSSTLEVGTGKSVFAQHLAEAFTDRVKEIHKVDVPFTSKNVVFRPEKLIEIAPTLPKYSAIVLDEWDEKNYMDKLAVTLRQFFRKCRQLNQFMIVIIPDFFQLPKGYAISRSVCAIDVKFRGEFERGYFDFYNFERKKELYIKGKKLYNYRASNPTFNGRFTKGYAIGEEEYRKAKLRDLKETEAREERGIFDERDVRMRLFKQIWEKASLEKNIKLTKGKLCEWFGINPKTGYNWLRDLEDVDVTEDDYVDDDDFVSKMDDELTKMLELKGDNSEKSENVVPQYTDTTQDVDILQDYKPISSLEGSDEEDNEEDDTIK